MCKTRGVGGDARRASGRLRRPTAGVGEGPWNCRRTSRCRTRSVPPLQRSTCAHRYPPWWLLRSSQQFSVPVERAHRARRELDSPARWGRARGQTVPSRSVQRQVGATCVSPLPRGRSFTRPWIEGGRPSAESSGSDIVLDRSVTLHVSRVLGICVTLALCVSRHLSPRLLLDTRL